MMTPALNRFNTPLRALFWLSLLGILAGSIAGVLIERDIRGDFGNFYVAGQKALFGETEELYDNFALVQGKKPFSYMAFLSAPITSYLYVPLAIFEPHFAAILFKAAGTICLWLGLFLLYRHLRNMITDPSWYLPFKALFTFSALLFQPFWSFYQVSGQTTPMVFLLLVLALVLRHRNHAVGPAICLVAVAAISRLSRRAYFFCLLCLNENSEFRYSHGRFSRRFFLCR